MLQAFLPPLGEVRPNWFDVQHLHVANPMCKFFMICESLIYNISFLAIQHRAVHPSACLLSTNSHDRLMLLVNVVSLLETIDHHPS